MPMTMTMTMTMTMAVTMAVMCVYTLVAYIAISFFMQIVKRFGAVTGVLSAAGRKVMTLVLSFLLFPKEFSWLYVMGSALVLGSLLTNSLLKIRRKSPKFEENSNSTVNIGSDDYKRTESKPLVENGESRV